MWTQEIVATETTQQRPLGRKDATPPLPTPHTLDDVFELMGAPMRFAQNAEIYGEEESADYFFKVAYGAVRTYELLSDGRRQISAFHLTGDLFGLGTGQDHRFTAEAVADSIIVVVKRSTLITLAARDSEIASELWAQTAGDLQRAQEHMLLLGRKNAQERVATFLLEMASRISAEESVDLPMSRQDMADYLGLTIETVSRTMTQLEGAAVIAIQSCRRILLLNRGALRCLNSGSARLGPTKCDFPRSSDEEGLEKSLSFRVMPGPAAGHVCQYSRTRMGKERSRPVPFPRQRLAGRADPIDLPQLN